jgi:hypothetical protein
LISALVEYAALPSRSRARRFLVGLSSDELQFIAGFLGGCILESAELREYRRLLSRPRSEDQEHKVLVLREDLAQSGLVPAPQ